MNNTNSIPYGRQTIDQSDIDSVVDQILCRRILEHRWFPAVNRPGFHSERPDSHAFLEQWIPFDYANQVCDDLEDQPDLSRGRFGDWSRAPRTWRGYHPSHDDYQEVGSCRRTIYRCLNVGTRTRSLSQAHVREAFAEAQAKNSAIVAFANHDYRDMTNDINAVRQMLKTVKLEFPDVLIKYAGAEEAARSLMGCSEEPAPKLSLELTNNILYVEVTQGAIFGPQPFLAIKTKEGQYFHDNLDVVVPRKKWSYVLDAQTLGIDTVARIGVGVAGSYGKTCVITIDF